SIPASVHEKKQNVPTAVGGGSLHIPSSFEGTRAAGGGGGACEQATARTTSNTGTSLMSLIRIAMNGVRREGRQAYRDVFCAIRVRTAVANPLAGSGHDRLARAHVDDTAFVFDAHHAA